MVKKSSFRAVFLIGGKMELKKELFDSLVEKRNQLLHENSLLDIQLEEKQSLLNNAEDEAFETRVRALAMQEICQTTKERLFRAMGYVKSFHDNIDYGESAHKVETKKDLNEK